MIAIGLDHEFRVLSSMSDLIVRADQHLIHVPRTSLTMWLAHHLAKPQLLRPLMTSGLDIRIRTAGGPAGSLCALHCASLPLQRTEHMPTVGLASQCDQAWQHSLCIPSCALQAPTVQSLHGNIFDPSPTLASGPSHCLLMTRPG